MCFLLDGACWDVSPTAHPDLKRRDGRAAQREEVMFMHEHALVEDDIEAVASWEQRSCKNWHVWLLDFLFCCG